MTALLKMSEINNINTVQFDKQISNNGIAYYCNAMDISPQNKQVPILLIHGVGLCSESWHYQVDYLTQQDYLVYAIDMPGHGESEVFANDVVNLDSFVEAINGFVKDVIQRPCIIMGHSLGAMISTKFAADYGQNCLGLVALNAVYKRSKSAEILVMKRAQELAQNEHCDVSSSPIKRWFGDKPSERDAKNAQDCRLWLDSGNRKGYMQAYDVFSKTPGPSDDVLAKIKCKSLYLTGEFDYNSSPEMSKNMAQRTKNGTHLTISNSRHMTQMTHAEKVNSALKSFIQNVIKDGSQQINKGDI